MRRTLVDSGMAKAFNNSTQSPRGEPRWPAILTVLAITGLYVTLPERLTPGPTWAFVLSVTMLLVPAIVLHRTGRPELNRIFGIMLLVVITLAVIWSLAMLIAWLPGKREAPQQLLRSAVSLWISNILLFASWYWRLDAGGPHARDQRASHTEGAFLFPQMTLPPGSKLAERNWKPGFVDYLFLAFNTSTAFSPTDAPVLSRWAKGLMMVQSFISLCTIALLAARAVNIL